MREAAPFSVRIVGGLVSVLGPSVRRMLKIDVVGNAPPRVHVARTGDDVAVEMHAFEALGVGREMLVAAFRALGVRSDGDDVSVAARANTTLVVAYLLAVLSRDSGHARAGAQAAITDVIVGWLPDLAAPHEVAARAVALAWDGTL